LFAISFFNTPNVLADVISEFACANSIVGLFPVDPFIYTTWPLYISEPLWLRQLTTNSVATADIPVRLEPSP